MGGHSPVFMELARESLPYLPDRGSNGVFLQNGSRLYLDCGGHPELATPELANPWDACRYALAGDRILGTIADRLGRSGNGRRTGRSYPL